MNTKFRIRFCLLLITFLVCSTFFFLLKNDSNSEKTDIILSILGSRNTSAFVKPLQNTILIDVPHLFPRFPSVSDFRLREKTLAGKTLGEFGLGQDFLFSKQKEPRILIVVLSQIGYEKERQTIRETWYKWTEWNKNVKVVFFLGLPSTETFDLTKIEKESQEHKDIILDDMRESYYLLAVKVLRILKWFQQRFPVENSLQGKTKNYRPDFLVKTDHDVFVNIPKLITDLRLQINNPDFVGGLIHNNNSVYRDKNEKWFTPEQLWAKDMLPVCVGGAFYCMAGNIVSRIYETSLQEPLFHFEDVFITGFVANVKLGIQLQEMFPPPPQNLNFLSQIQVNFFGRNPNSAIAFHSVDTKLMKYFYRQVVLYKK